MAFTNHFGTIPPQFSSCLFLTTSLPITKSENHHVHIAIDGFGRTNHTCLFCLECSRSFATQFRQKSSFFLSHFFTSLCLCLTNQLIVGLNYPSPLGSSNCTLPSAPTTCTCYGTLNVITNAEYGRARMAAATRRGSKA